MILKSNDGGDDDDDDDVVFDRKRFVHGITIGGLETRCREKDCGGKTKAKQTIKFTDYTIAVSPGPVTYSSRKFTYINEYHVAEVQFVLRTKPKEKRKGPVQHQALYVEQYDNVMKVLKKKKYDVNKLNKGECCVLLWVAYEYWYRSLDKTLSSQQVKDKLNDYVKADKLNKLGIPRKGI